jgi:hypothetical protein
LRDSYRIDVIPAVVSASPLVVEDCKDQLLKEVSEEFADAAELVFVTEIPNDVSRLAYVDPNLDSELTADRIIVEGLVRNEPRRIGIDPVPV